MIQIAIENIQLNSQQLLHHVAQGETVVLTMSGQPVAEVKPLSPPHTTQRPFGLCAGEFRVPEDFNTPLPDSILLEFEGQ